MRPFYETKEDRVREKDIAKMFAGRLGLVAKPNPVAYPVDYSFVNTNNEVRGFAEIKSRGHRFGTYPTYMISAMKLSHAQSLSRATHKNVFLVVGWSCGTIAHIDMNTEPDLVGWGGRTDRGDADDMEPVVYWNIERFIKARCGKY